MLRKTSAAIFGIGLASLVANGQTSEPKFELASVRISTAVNSSVSGGPGTTTPTQKRWINLTLANLIAEAYQLRESRVTWSKGATNNGPFDVIANLPAGTTKEQLPIMLQALLADRFGLQVHREQKELPGYELTVAKGGLKNMKESLPPAETPAPGPKRIDKDGFPEYGPGVPVLVGQMSGGHTRQTAVLQTMPQIVGFLRNELGGAEVVDRTSLTGMYDFKLHFATRSSIQEALRRARAASGQADPVVEPRDEVPAPDLATAVQEQLGLKLESKKVLADLIVVDRVSKVPTEN